MADLLEKLWPAFVSEVTEQLDSVELLLAKSSSAKSVDVNHLFRNFHTIKGNCSMIGFTSMETIAHRSEDILAAVRNDEIPMNDDVIDILLDSISCLKKQFNSASESKINPDQDDALVERLTVFVEQALGGEEPEVEASEEDKVAILQALSMSAKMAVPVLVLGLDPAAKIEQVETAIVAMADKAIAGGFKALSGALRHFIATLKDASVENKEDHLLNQVAEIFDVINFICTENNVDLNLDLGAKLCRSKLNKPYMEQLGILEELLGELKTTDSKDWQVEQFLNLVDHADRLTSYASLFGLGEQNASWRYIKQLVVEVSRGYIVFNNAIIDKLLKIVALGKEEEALAGGSPDFEAKCKAAREELQDTTAKHNNERDEIIDLKEEITSKTTLVFDSLVDLKIDVLETINSAIDEGKLAVEIDIDFSDEVVSEKVLMAVRNLGELAHSRTMFHDIVNGVAQRTSFSFLILTTKSVDDVDKVLSIIDRERKSYVILGFEEHFGVDSSPENEDNTSDSSANSQGSVEKKSKEKTVVDKADSPASDASLDESEETEALVSETAMSLGSLKVEGNAIDTIISDVGELITHYNRMAHLITQDEFAMHILHIKNLLQNSAIETDSQDYESVAFFEDLYSQLNATNESLQTSLNQIQGSVLDLRVVPIAYAFNRFHKFVRTISQKLGKKVILDVVGETVKVDKGMIDVLSEPLAHMVRNSIDHGIESPDIRKHHGKDEFGLIKLTAEQQSGMVIIKVIDDGAGLNRDKILDKCIRLGMLSATDNHSDQDIYKHVFEPGFSTSETLTETSGRGVGMDVVKSKIVEVGGSVSIDSNQDEGTVITLKLPISAAIQSVILIDNGGQTLAFPERHINEVLSVKKQDIQVINDQSAMMLRDSIVPIYRLDNLLHSRNTIIEENEGEEFEILVIANDQHMMGLVVDAALGRTEVLVRDVHETLRYMVGVSGAAILGDGKVVIILDCDELFELALNNAQNIIAMSKAG